MGRYQASVQDFTRTNLNNKGSPIKIAIAQIGPVTGDLDGNARKIIEAIREARRRGCDIVVTPEAATTGYMCCDLFEVDACIRKNKEYLSDCIVPETKDIVAVVGFIDYEEVGGAITKRYNAAALIQDRKIKHVSYKRNLCRYRFFDETRYFTAGSETHVTELEVGKGRVRIATAICEDLWDEGYPASPYDDAARQNADLLVVLNASPFEAGKCDTRVKLIRKHQQKKTIPVVYGNTVGIGDNLKSIILFDGRSMAFDARGRLACCAPMFHEKLCVVNFDDNFEVRERVSLPSWTEEEELHAALTYALRRYCDETGFERVVVGMSGGIDSSLCAVLAAQSLGSDNVLGLSMPSRYSSSETRRDAEILCRNLGIEFRRQSIENLYKKSLEGLKAWPGIHRGVTRENLQARLRGLMLMAVSNETDRLVVATGNKTELGLGYCTLYGDMVGGLLLIGDINKVQVYRLAEFLNRRAEGELIPAPVIHRPPSAELADDQVDPFDYPVVAQVVDDVIARKDSSELLKAFEERSLDGRYPQDVYERYDGESFSSMLSETYRRYRKNAFKRAQSSPTVIVSRRALGFDLRETLINRWY